MGGIRRGWLGVSSAKALTPAWTICYRHLKCRQISLKHGCLLKDLKIRGGERFHRPGFLRVEKGAAHGFEFFDLFEKDVLGKLKVISEAGKAEEFRGTAVDQFPGQSCFILCQERAAADAFILFSHGQAPGSKDRASYHGRELWD